MKAKLDDFSIDVIKAAFKATLFELLVALQFCKQPPEGVKWVEVQKSKKGSQQWRVSVVVRNHLCPEGPLAVTTCLTMEPYLGV